MTNYGPPGGGNPGPWRGQRPDETPGRPVQQPYPPAPGPYPPPGPSYPPPGQSYPQPGQSYPPPGQSYPPPGQSYPQAPQERPGPYGGPPNAPYGGGAGTPYGGAPAAPYGGAYQPTGANTGYDQQPYRPDENPYGPDPTPAPGRRGRGPLIAVLAVVLLLAAAGGVFWFLRGQDDPAPVAAPTTSTAAVEPSADADGAEPPPSDPAPESSADPRFAKVGQCVRNDAAADGKPKLLISECAAKSYEVLSRIDGATSGERDAETKCDKVPGYTNWYFFDSELDTLDFVLCLKQR